LSNSANNLPNNAIDNVAKGVPCNTMTELNLFRELQKCGKVRDNQELMERIELIIESCIRNDVRLGVELLSLGLGISRQTFWRWCNGVDCDEERQEICLNAKQYIHAYLEQLALKGKINPATSIFWAKNIMGYKDNIEVIEPNKEDAPKISINDLIELNKISALNKQTEAELEDAEAGSLSFLTDLSDFDNESV
jgi:hypothetical protein